MRLRAFRSTRLSRKYKEYLRMHVENILHVKIPGPWVKNMMTRQIYISRYCDDGESLLQTLNPQMSSLTIILIIFLLFSTNKILALTASNPIRFAHRQRCCHKHPSLREDGPPFDTKKYHRTRHGFFRRVHFAGALHSRSNTPISTVAATLTGGYQKDHRDMEPLSPHETVWGHPPHLALLTEPDACASLQRMEQTLYAIEQATADGDISLVVVRVVDDSSDNHDDKNLNECSTNATMGMKWALLQKLAEMKQHQQLEGKRGFLLVVNNDADVAVRAISQNIALDGIHVKEKDARLIPSLRKRLYEAASKASTPKGSSTVSPPIARNIIIGTSCHSIRSAIQSYQLFPEGPDYLFVGTCYLTQSHPEKTSLDQLEGPSLPGRVKQELCKMFNNVPSGGHRSFPSLSLPSPPPPTPKVFAIGGIDERNCVEPVLKYGADGVATIRAVMQAKDPRRVVQLMKRVMQWGEG